MSSGNDMKAHESTFASFTGLVKWSSIVTALIAAFTIYMISN